MYRHRPASGWREPGVERLVGREETLLHRLDESRIDADDAPSPEEQVVEASDLRHRRGLLKRALSLLTPRERMIVRARRLEEERRTLAALGRELGISKERVRQIENEALDKLRAMLSGQLGDGRRAEFAPS